MREGQLLTNVQKCVYVVPPFLVSVAIIILPGITYGGVPIG